MSEKEVEEIMQHLREGVNAINKNLSDSEFVKAYKKYYKKRCNSQLKKEESHV